MDTNCLSLALAEKELEDCIRREMKAKWKHLLSKVCANGFAADAVIKFSRQMSYAKQKTKPSERNSDAELCLWSKTYSGYDITTNKYRLSCKGLNKRLRRQSGDGPLEKIAAS